jgi:hypothetical protein
MSKTTRASKSGFSLTGPPARATKRSPSGEKVIDRMAHDLKEELPDMKGFSPRNLKYMRKFAESWSNFERAFGDVH